MQRNHTHAKTGNPSDAIIRVAVVAFDAGAIRALMRMVA
ncbi:predicted protein [Plenodomus lingam JN3]|uniref:Uncharacterized protein n=1 Tax=Leptosphaeria maculans (strain JN3 / isolate v23.1.3 / race Av1-4-5-6-7-8) TaxID=985895 RepID=E4ZFS2_LEPMJ|nr:predicted protein [Plenodomus lingam JN3]CBX90142.1 predicted protein [Plenodomus lingam JN3]